MIEESLFSVLIANYNNGKYLEEAIQSVRDQTYHEWEIIIVDDASSDNSKELYNRYRVDSRIKIFYNDKNRGCGFTKHRCVEKATGELCGFLDPDDVITERALEIMVESHKENSNASLICSRYIVCDEELNEREVSEQTVLKQGLSYLENGELSPEVFASFKKQLYDKTEGINPDLPRAVDQDLYLRLEEVGEMLFLNDVTYKYRIHNTSVSNQGNYKALYWLTRVVHDACVRRGLSPEEYGNRLLAKYIDRYKNKYNGLINSKTYKVSRVLISPFLVIKKAFNNKA